MAGMLPGVESARRRRCHQKSNLSELSSTTTRRSSFCLYASSSSHEFHLTTSNSSTQRSSVLCDESSLGTEAREAKKRLDQRLQPHWRSQITRSRSSNGEERWRWCLQERLRWLKLNWKASEQEECAVCLEELTVPETLMQVRCGHRFHKNCLVPWLEANGHCPCCRMQIPAN